MALRGFRFHLSTAILLMFAAGGLIGLNLQQRFVGGEVFCRQSSSRDIALGELHFGFPMTAYNVKGWLWRNIDVPELERQRMPAVYANPQFIVGHGVFYARIDPRVIRPEFKFAGIFIDGLSGLAILSIVGFTSEYLIHRKSNRSALSTQDSALPL